MNLSFRETMRAWLPPWLTDRPGKTLAFSFLYAPALLADLGMEFLVQGVRARFPGVGTNTALPYIGRDRRLRRGPEEPEAIYVARLLDWREQWKRAGNAFEIMRQVKAWLYPHTPKMRIATENGTWYTLDPDDTQHVHPTSPKNWEWDGRADLWDRFWLIIYADGLWSRDGTWADGETWGDLSSSTWGSTATKEQVGTIRALVNEWKSADARCPNIIVAFDNASFDPTGAPGAPLPDGTWGHWSIDDAGDQVPSRLDTAIYLDGAR